MNAHQQIQAFEKNYLHKFETWNKYIEKRDLDELIATMETVDRESRLLTRSLAVTEPDLFRDRWQPLLRRIMDLLPSIQQHLDNIRADTAGELQVIEKGQRSLKGYRNTNTGQGGIVDSSG